jgi:hypothetical protein
VRVPGSQGRAYQMAHSKPVLSFAAIVLGRDSSVRVTDDGLGDVVDVVMVVTGKNCNHANEALRNLKPSLFDNENFVIRNGRRYASLRDIIALIMVLPGKMAKELRSQFAEIIEDYIRKNLFSDDGSSEHTGFKRKREQLEYLKTEEEIRCMAQTRILAACAELERYRDPSRNNLDERTRLMMQDSLQNSILNTCFSVSLTTTKSIQNKPISIASVAKELGYKPTTTDAKRIGLDLRKRYIDKHGSPPTKHDQLCDGRVTQVNSYTEQDRSLLEEALHAYFKPDEDEKDKE